MVNTFKIGDEVRVISALSKMRDLEGKVTAIRGENSYLPFIVDLKDFGEWSFKKDDLEFKDKSKSKHDKIQFTENGVTNEIEFITGGFVKHNPKEVAEKSGVVKRPYKKRDKTKPVKAKRPYNRKVKS